jgi:hypothetical protein
LQDDVVKTILNSRDLPILASIEPGQRAVRYEGSPG